MLRQVRTPHSEYGSLYGGLTILLYHYFILYSEGREEVDVDVEYVANDLMLDEKQNIHLPCLGFYFFLYSIFSCVSKCLDVDKFGVLTLLKRFVQLFPVDIFRNSYCA